MNIISEQEVENAVLKMLKKLGYKIIFGPDIAPDSENPKRKDWDNVLLEDDLKATIEKLNPQLPEDAIEEAIKKIKRLNSINIIKNNEEL